MRRVFCLEENAKTRRLLDILFIVSFGFPFKTVQKND